MTPWRSRVTRPEAGSTSTLIGVGAPCTHAETNPGQHTAHPHHHTPELASAHTLANSHQHTRSKPHQHRRRRFVPGRAGLMGSGL
eukprot:3150089-Rhodomonas_salina.1